MEPQTIENLQGPSSINEFMRVVSKMIEAGIEAAISPFQQMIESSDGGKS